MAELNPADTSNSDTSTATTPDNDICATKCPTIFNKNQPLVLELHELKKDDPATADAIAPTTTTTSQPAVPASEAKAKKKKKRKRLFGHESKEPAKVASAASVSSSEADVDTTTKEEFYDARESYHGIAPPPPPVQVVGSQITAAPAMQTSMGSTIASVPSDVLESLKLSDGNVEISPEVSPEEPPPQDPIHKPTAPPQ